MTQEQELSLKMLKSMREKIRKERDEANRLAVTDYQNHEMYFGWVDEFDNILTQICRRIEMLQNLP